MITSTGNARVKQLVTWQKKRKARDEEGVYIVEGIRMYREAPRAQVREVYVSEQFYSRYGEELGLSAWGRQLENPVRSCIFPRVRYKDTTGDPACDGAEEL